MKSTVYTRLFTSCAAAATAAFTVTILLAAAPNGLRSIFLNGTDISGARNQQLKNVDIQISESGDIFIIAPHYQVSEEDAFTPLSKFVQGVNQGMNAPEHKAPQKISSAEAPVMAAPSHSEPQQLEKAGTPVPEDVAPAKAEEAPPALPEDGDK